EIDETKADGQRQQPEEAALTGLGPRPERRTYRRHHREWDGDDPPDGARRTDVVHGEASCGRRGCGLAGSVEGTSRLRRGHSGTAESAKRRTLLSSRTSTAVSSPRRNRTLRVSGEGEKLESASSVSWAE